MAKPDTDDGWLKYAHELDAALAVADFSKGARIVLREVFAQIFGRRKLRAATISPTEIASASGQRKQNIWRAVQELCECQVLARQPNGSFRFRKDYERWLIVPRGKEVSEAEPRLSREEIAWCQQASARAMGLEVESEGNSAPETVIPLDYQSTDENTPSNPVGLPKVIPLDYQSNPVGLPGIKRNGRAEFKNLRIQDNTTTPPNPPTGGDVVADDPPASPGKPITEAKLLSAAPHHVTDAQMDALVLWARGVLTDHLRVPPFDRGEECFLYGKLRGYCQCYPTEWVEIAILCASAKADLASARIAEYINGCLRSWHVRGKPNVADVRTAERAGATKKLPPFQFVSAPADFPGPRAKGAHDS